MSFRGACPTCISAAASTKTRARSIDARWNSGRNPEQMIREGKNPAEHHVLSWSMPDLHFCRGQYEDARQIYRRKVEFWEKSVTRPDNIDLGHLQMRLAAAEAHTGHRAEAQEMYTRAEATFAREWCEAHPKVAAARAAKADLTPAPLFR